jgi:hypothetical protein
LKPTRSTASAPLSGVKNPSFIAAVTGRLSSSSFTTAARRRTIS